MKIPKVEKLPSGRYRVQVQVGGKRYGETFDTPEEAQFWVAGSKTRITSISSGATPYYPPPPLPAISGSGRTSSRPSPPRSCPS